MRVEVIDEHNQAGHLLHIGSFIGAFSRGRTQGEALAKVPREVARYCRWLGLPFDREETMDIQIVQEKVSDLRVEDADSDVLFEGERSPLTLAEYQRLKALALKSAADFLLLYSSVPEKDRTSLPPRKTFYGDVPRTAEEMYFHTRNVNAYYFGEIGVPADNEGDILTCRAAGFSRLEAQPGFLSNGVVSGSYDEAWSIRKVCRRFVWHDTIHAKAMYRMAVGLWGEGAVADPFRFSQRPRQALPD